MQLHFSIFSRYFTLLKKTTCANHNVLSKKNIIGEDRVGVYEFDGKMQLVSAASLSLEALKVFTWRKSGLKKTRHQNIRIFDFIWR